MSATCTVSTIGQPHVFEPDPVEDYNDTTEPN